MYGRTAARPDSGFGKLNFSLGNYLSALPLQRKLKRGDAEEISRKDLVKTEIVYKFPKNFILDFISLRLCVKNLTDNPDYLNKL